MIYKKDSMKPESETKEAPVGVYEMICASEGVSKTNPKRHWFLFKNDQYHVFHNLFLSNLTEFADQLSVHVESDGSVDTEKFKNVKVKLEIMEEHSKDGRAFKFCKNFQRLDDNLEDIPF